jgi:hypothetical protein
MSLKAMGKWAPHLELFMKDPYKMDGSMYLEHLKKLQAKSIGVTSLKTIDKALASSLLQTADPDKVVSSMGLK